MSNSLRTRTTVSAEMHLDFAAGEIWPLLCPIREYDWIEVWDCELLQSRSGFNELGCVFKTNFPAEGGEEIWLTSRFDPMECIEFVRTNQLRVIHFTVTLMPEDEGTRLTWSQHITPLNTEGDAYVKDKPQAYATQMAMLETMLAHYLETGTMLKGESLGLLERIKTHVHHRKTR